MVDVPSDILLEKRAFPLASWIQLQISVQLRWDPSFPPPSQCSDPVCHEHVQGLHLLTQSLCVHLGINPAVSGRHCILGVICRF